MKKKLSYIVYSFFIVSVLVSCTSQTMMQLKLPLIIQSSDSGASSYVFDLSAFTFTKDKSYPGETASRLTKDGVFLWDGINEPIFIENEDIPSTNDFSATVTAQGVMAYFDNEQSTIHIKEAEKEIVIYLKEVEGLGAQQLLDHIQAVRKVNENYQVLMSTSPFEQFVLIEGEDNNWKAIFIDYKKSPAGGQRMPPFATDTIIQDNMVYTLIDRGLVSIDLDKKTWTELSTFTDYSMQLDQLRLQPDEGHTVSMVGMHSDAILLRMQVGEGEDEALYALYVKGKATQLWHIKGGTLSLFDMKGTLIKKIENLSVKRIYLPRSMNELQPITP